ncbi:MAG: Gfo/Idh/MocA family oxidoreductase, partial [Clostridia bacterium]|nr:Gfo/Idh/MocA family oxidoreductase [Clostridia bacterium]
MADPIKVGVIGMGQMGVLHAKVYRKLPLVELVAFCEFNDDRRKEMAEEFQCTAYKSYKEMLADPNIDAVSIVLPDDIHREAVEIAVANNKHILLEKPLAKELEDGKILYEITKDYDKVFTVGFLLRFDPRFSMIKDALDKGELGDIIHLYCRRNSPIIGPRRYIGSSDLSMHVMIHDIDYINWYMGCDPVKVFAKSRSVLLKDNNMNDVIYAIVTYENGAI